MEIEIVILEIDKAAIVKKLLAFGAKKFFDEDMEQVQYKSDGSLFRIRKEGNKTIFNMKKRVKDSQFKLAEEYEVEIDNFDTMKTMLEHLPVTFVRTLNKHRESYKIGSIKFEFDKYQDVLSHVPEFLEIEGEDEKEIMSWVGKLQIPIETVTNLSTTRIIKHYNSQK